MGKPKRVKVDVQPYDEFKDFAPYTKRIRALCDGVVKSAIEIGRELLKAQADPEICRPGSPASLFHRWIEEVLGFSKSQGYRFMDAAKHFGPHYPKLGRRFSDSAMYVLAAPSAPEAAREAAIGIAEQGGRVTHKKAVELVEAYKEPAEDPDFDVLVELEKWGKALEREYERYPEDARREFIEETEDFVKLKLQAMEADNDDG
jgi:hypothetical protein